jgi:hypothetical protein
VLARAQVDAFAERVRDMRRRKELAGEIAPPGKAPTDVLTLLNRRPGDLSREEARAIGGWNPLLWKDFFKGVYESSVEVEESVRLLLAMKGRNRKTDELAEATWHRAHGMGARWLFTTMGELEWVEPVMGKWTDTFAPTQMATQLRTLSIALRGWWAAARMGKHVLPLYKRAVNEEQPTIGLFDAVLGATAIGLRHARCVPEVKRILELLPAAAGPGAAEWSKEVVAGCTRALDDPDGSVEAALRFGRVMYGAYSRILAPAGSPHRAERDEDVTREQALLVIANNDGDCMVKTAMEVLPWVARVASPEDFYFPEEAERVMRHPLTPARTTPWLERLRDGRVTAIEPQRVGERPGRNDPCSCGSGAKFKKCCGR